VRSNTLAKAYRSLDGSGPSTSLSFGLSVRLLRGGACVPASGRRVPEVAMASAIVSAFGLRLACGCKGTQLRCVPCAPHAAAYRRRAVQRSVRLKPCTADTQWPRRRRSAVRHHAQHICTWKAFAIVNREQCTHTVLPPWPSTSGVAISRVPPSVAAGVSSAAGATPSAAHKARPARCLGVPSRRRTMLLVLVGLPYRRCCSWRVLFDDAPER